MQESTKNKPIDPERIFHVYGELFPDEFEFLVLYNLYRNYPSVEMQYVEIRQAITDTFKLPFFHTGKDRQIERILKNLMRAFIERVPGRFNQFVLTPHSERIVEIVTQRINNPYLKFPLKDTFELYFKLPDNAAKDITLLKSWFRFGFQNNARQVVLSHLEGLKLAVDDAIKALNQVLEATDLSAIQMLEQFSQHFQILGEKARQITEATGMKDHVYYKLRDIMAAFSEILDVAQSEGFIENAEDFLSLRADYNTAIEIKEEVYSFFEKVDKQLDLINTKMAFAGSKITELQESLRAQSHYKISLKKMLAYLLRNSRSDPQQWILLPDGFPVKDIVQQKFRFKTLRYYDMGFLKRSKPFEQKEDLDYEAEQRAHIELELVKQARIQNYCEQAQNDLAKTGRLDLVKRIFEIIKEENDEEIGIQTSYEFIRNLTESDKLSIEDELESNATNTIHIWKTTIQISQDLGS